MRGEINVSTVLITGGVSGLGRVIAEEFLKLGYKIACTYKNSDKAANELKELYKENVMVIKADASDYTDVVYSVNKVIEEFGTIDILVNNAASSKDGSLRSLKFEEFDYTIKNVLYPVYNYCKATVDFFIEKKQGKIINIGSINGMRGREGSLGYSTAKAGIEGFTKTIAKELGSYGINCNVVAPGYINTETQYKTSELIKKMVLNECAIRRLTEPIEVANLVLFLASEKANNITGQVYQIDCGQYI